MTTVICGAAGSVVKQHAVFINQSWSCCLVNIHPEWYYDILLIRGGLCWAGRPGGTAKAGEINALVERLLSALRGLSSGIQSFSAGLMRRSSCSVQPQRSVDLQPSIGLTERRGRSGVGKQSKPGCWAGGTLIHRPAKHSNLHKWWASSLF